MLTEADSGKTIPLKVGEILEISLPGNPTTGFHWEALPQQPDLLQTVGEAQLTPPGSRRAGAGGLVTLRFSARSPGETTLQLVYRRSWQKDSPPARTFEIKIQVS